VDYLIRGASGNPVAIELKPPLVWDKRQKKIFSRDLDWHLRDLSSMESSGRNQVKDYLRDYEYVVLTNLVEYALFNREALVRFEPFARGEFCRSLPGNQAGGRSLGSSQADRGPDASAWLGPPLL
jgi:hypothetical protein